MLAAFCQPCLATNLPPALSVSGTTELVRIKLTTRAEGLHRVKAEALAPLLGEAVQATRERIRQGRIGLMNRGRAAGCFPGNEGAELLFYAEPLRNNYTEENVYWLSEPANLSNPARDGGAPEPAAESWWPARLRFEEDLLARYETGTHPDSNYWYWVELVGSHRFRGKFQHAYSLDALAGSNLTAQLTVRVFGRTETNHSLALAVNGVTNAAWQANWHGLQAAAFTFAIPAGALRDGGNTNVFTALGSTASQWWLDGCELEFPRRCQARQGQLEFDANANSVVTVTGFTRPEIQLLEVSDPRSPAAVTNAAVNASDGGWSLSFVPGSPDARYAAWQPDAALPEPVMQAVMFQGLDQPTNRAALVIIAHPSLLTSARALAEYRRQQGLETKVVAIDSIYDEFNWGLREPEAVRTFLRFAWNQWQLKPAYALLAGNGTYDYRNLLNKSDNLVPPLMAPTLYGLAASDTLFGEVQPELPGPEISVGRLPALTPEQLDAVVNKIKRYETAPLPAGKRALLVADNPDAAGDFVGDLNTVQAGLAGTFETAMVFPPDFALMRGQILSNLNRGSDLLCYLGHGAADRLGSQGYLTAADAASLANGARPPFLVAMTCLAGIFAEPAYDCLAESFLLAATNGAIAVLSPTGLSLNPDATSLNLHLMKVLVEGAPGQRLGDLVRAAMIRYGREPAHSTPAAIYGIMGDPSLRYRGLPAMPPGIAGIRRMNDTIELTLSGLPGQSYTLLATTNAVLPLASWSVLASGVLPYSPLVFTDVSAFSIPGRFYTVISGQ